MNPNLSPEQFPKSFEHLRPETQKAVRQYMAEGEVSDLDNHLRQFEFVERDEPLEQVKKGVMAGEDVQDIATDFDEYHRWYTSMGDTPEHTERWPAIRSKTPENDGYFEDGWHRFHSYVAQGDSTIPTVEMRRRA